MASDILRGLFMSALHRAAPSILFLKATTTKTITVPGYTRADGVFVPPHQKVVHYDPAKSHADVLAGKGSHSQKVAHAKLSKLAHWSSLDEHDKLAHILSAATNHQKKQSAAAAVSGWKAAMLAGDKPTKSQQAAFEALPHDKAMALLQEVSAKVPEMSEAAPNSSEVAPNIAAPAPDVPAADAPVTVASVKLVKDPVEGPKHVITFSNGATAAIVKLSSAESMGLPGWHDADAVGSKSSYLSDFKDEAVAAMLAKQQKAVAAPTASSPLDDWKALTSKHWGDITEMDDVAPFLKDPKLAGPAALQAFSSGAFSEINENPDAPASKALLAYIAKLPTAEHQKVHRVLGFNDAGGAAFFVAEMAAGGDPHDQKRTLSSWTATDPAAPGQTPMNNIALDLASVFGDHRVFLTLDGHQSGKDISFAYAKDGKMKPGGEIVLPKGAKLDVVSISKSGKDTHLVVREVHDGDTKLGADGGTLVLKDGHWHKYVDADESGEVPPVLVPVAPHVAAIDAVIADLPQPGPTNAEHVGAMAKIGDLLNGEGGHYPVKAAKQLDKEKALDGLLGVDALQKVMDLAKKMQAAASASAAVSGWLKAAKAGKNPAPAQWKAFVALPGAKKAALLSEVDTAAGGHAHLQAPSFEVPDAKAAAIEAQAVEPAPVDQPEPVLALVTEEQAVEGFKAAGLVSLKVTGSVKSALEYTQSGNAGELVEMYAELVGDELPNLAKKVAIIGELAGLDMAASLAAGAPVAKKKPSPMAAAKPLAGKPAYDHMAQTIKGLKHDDPDLNESPVLTSAADDWLADNPGKEAELSEALAALGLHDTAAMLDLPAPDDDGPEDEAPAAKPAPAAKVPAAVKKLQDMDPAAIAEWMASPVGKKSDFAMSFWPGVTKPGQTKFMKWLNAAGKFGTPPHWKDVFTSAAIGSLYGKLDMALLADGTWKKAGEVTIGESKDVVTDPAKIQAAAIAEKMGAAAAPKAEKPPAPAVLELSGTKYTQQGESWVTAGGAQYNPGGWMHVALSAMNGDPISPAVTDSAKHKALNFLLTGDAGSVLSPTKALNLLFPPSDAGPHEGDTKVVDGVTYVLTGGRWHKQDEDDEDEGDIITADEHSALLIWLSNGMPKGWPIAQKWEELSPDAKAALQAEAHDEAAAGETVEEAAADSAGPAGDLEWVVFHNTEPGHSKFWAATVADGKLITHYGKIGAKGSVTVKDYGSEMAALDAYDAIIAKKQKGGYVSQGEFQYYPLPGDAKAPPKAKDAVKVGEAVVDASGWQQTGQQKGSNPGGRFRDPSGQDWYVKTPATADHAKNELLAAKLYAAAGVKVPELKVVTKDGKTAIASKWADGLKKAASPDELGMYDGALSGFAVDAWLGNWDVTGLGLDNLLVDPDQKAVRIDVGGALLYRAQGEPKGSAFVSDDVPEIDTLVDPKMNSLSAALFGGMSKAAVEKSVERVLAVSDADIQQLCMEFGPGSPADRAALAAKLIERKQALAKRFPKAKGASGPVKKKLDPTALPVNPSDLPPYHDFHNWNGPGQGLSSKAHLNDANLKAEKDLHDFALKGNLVALKAYQFEAVDKETGASLGMKPIAEHPSQHVKLYHSDLVQYLEAIANPPEALRVEAGNDPAAFAAYALGTTVNTVAASKRLGFWIALGKVGNVAPFAKHFVGKEKHVGAALVAASKAKFNEWSKLARHFISGVQASGSYNDYFRDGHAKDSSGYSTAAIAAAAYKDAQPKPMGTTVYRWMNMPDSMVQQLLKADKGVVFQNPGSMCTSMSPTATKGFGKHRMVIHYADGAKGVDSFASGHFSSEQEITTLMGQRFMLLDANMSNNLGGTGKSGLEIHVLMLPPDPGYVADLNAKAGKALSKALDLFNELIGAAA